MAKKDATPTKEKKVTKEKVVLKDDKMTKAEMELIFEKFFAYAEEVKKYVDGGDYITDDEGIEIFNSLTEISDKYFPEFTETYFGDIANFNDKIEKSLELYPTEVLPNMMEILKHFNEVYTYCITFDQNNEGYDDFLPDDFEIDPDDEDYTDSDEVQSAIEQNILHELKRLSTYCDNVLQYKSFYKEKIES